MKVVLHYLALSLEKVSTNLFLPFVVYESEMSKKRVGNLVSKFGRQINIIVTFKSNLAINRFFEFKDQFIFASLKDFNKSSLICHLTNLGHNLSFHSNFCITDSTNNDYELKVNFFIFFIEYLSLMKMIIRIIDILIEILFGYQFLFIFLQKRTYFLNSQRKHTLK